MRRRRGSVHTRGHPCPGERESLCRGHAVRSGSHWWPFSLPLFKRVFQSSLDCPRFRYRRILVPFSAWLLAGGQDRFVDRAYLVTIWLWVFAGTLWTGLVARERGAHPGWSLAFLFVPAVTVSLDRLTMDVALVALTAGLVYYTSRQNWLEVAFVRQEYGADFTLMRPIPWLRAAGMAVSVVPALAWYLYVVLHTAPVGTGGLVSAIPFAGILTRLLHPVPYRFFFAANALATVLDYAALAGIVAAIVYCGVYWRRLLRQPEGVAAFAFVALVAVVSSPEVWEHAYGFARGFSPLLLLVGLDGFRSRSPSAALPVALTAPRIGLEMGLQLVGVVRGVLGL